MRGGGSLAQSGGEVKSCDLAPRQMVHPRADCVDVVCRFNDVTKAFLLRGVSLMPREWASAKRVMLGLVNSKKM